LTEIPITPEVILQEALQIIPVAGLMVTAVKPMCARIMSGEELKAIHACSAPAVHHSDTSDQGKRPVPEVVTMVVLKDHLLPVLLSQTEDPAEVAVRTREEDKASVAVV
jgi:hypothetical protein